MVTSSRAKVDKQGRIVIPADIRKSMGLESGGDVLLRVEDGDLRISTVMAGIRRAQAIVARFGQPERVLSEELIRERRLEAQRD